MKKSKVDGPQNDTGGVTASQIQEPSNSWVKKSWTKKKEKKLSINDFDQIKELGSGKYGHVFLAREKKSNFICALKIIEKKLLYEEEITEQFIRELKIQMFLNHPNIIRMYGYFDDAVNIYLILEMATGNQLFKQLKKLQSMPEQKVANIMRQVCHAVGELHAYQIIHRDIKPENIVLH
ncbi:UNVERIFIED_CONTAM: hypothetical protein GTU68_059179 [Idotea baltica]|nr:hypothetical protein [Idotea baltica]